MYGIYDVRWRTDDQQELEYTVLRTVAFAFVVAAGAAGFATGVAAADPSQPVFEDNFTVTVGHSGNRDGLYELKCHPAGGSYPDAAAVCDRLDQLATEMRRGSGNPFTPVAPRAVCTRMDGGPATAHIVGTWLGEPLDTTVDRTDGCQISRWDRLVPLLPRIA
ncbi:SSI family serine proteinase inhibitor [Nocardia terpenica]|uniref:SSI family serine proteinase inhibitor n=1 Tax=Nocardia terpenica TaxID=455432 RepID=UPI001932297E|nr:SSI family serine proteinase inhibitor [Nocardia terpenica]